MYDFEMQGQQMATTPLRTKRAVRGNSAGTKPKACTTCSRSNHKCQGHGLRLSWPRPNDCRRSVVCKSPLLSVSHSTGGKISDARFIHTSNWDIELYHRLTSSGPVRNLSLLGVPVSWNPLEQGGPEQAQELLEYFYCVASESLATFGHDTTTLSNVLVRMALQGEATPAAAVLQALLAFASLHRYGLQSQALELKTAALGSLAKGLDAQMTMQQHISTGMLLCSFEVHQSSCAAGQWTFHLGGVKTVLNASPSSVKEPWQVESDSDMATLLDWVHYHEVLARFSLLHWKREGALELPSTPPDLFCPQTSNLPPPIFSMLDLLSQVCDAVRCSGSDPQGTRGGTGDDYRGFLEVLDWRLRSLPVQKALDDDYLSDDTDDATLVMQLYQLAILLFLNRNFEGLLAQPSRMQEYVDTAFAILPQLSSCKPQFPIYIIGCEARTDEQRAVVLDVISRTEKMICSRPLTFCRSILQAVWAQDDLANGTSLGYREKLTAVMSHCLIVPSFV